MSWPRRSVALLENWPLPLRVLPAVLWSALIWLLSARPGSGSGSAWHVSLLLNGGHFVLFAGLAGLLAIAARARSLRADLLVWGAAVAWGALDEYHQAHVPGRDCSLLDLATDAAGAAFAVHALRALHARSPRARRGLVVAALLGAIAVGFSTFI
ncbi:MAG: VanZ family protein [Planctomycetes bacterium]|nr:VanZ family protein [Planctomycetota bacterium]